MSFSRNIGFALVKNVHDFCTFATNQFRHLPQNNCFILKLPKGQAEVTYSRENSVLNLQSTCVPDDYQGKGIGQLIAKNVFEYCLERNIKVKVSCEFLIKYLQKHQEFEKIILPVN